jgi:hypothetical protein
VAVIRVHKDGEVVVGRSNPLGVDDGVSVSHRHCTYQRA